MTDKREIVQQLLDSMRAEGPGVPAKSPRADLLTDDVVFTSAKGIAKGRDLVLENLAGKSAYAFYKIGDWSAPELLDGDVVQTIHQAAPGGFGATLRCHFTGDRIHLIQDQVITGAAIEHRGIKLSPEMKSLVAHALVKKCPMVMAYVDETGQPALSYRGSTQAFSDDQFAFWLREPQGNFAAAIAKNPKVAFMYRDNAGGGMLQFRGRARITLDEAERAKIYENSAEAERNHDYFRRGAAVIIDLDYIDGFASRAPDGRGLNPLRMVR